MSATHALRDKWFVSFLPLLVPDVVASQFKGDWNLAAQKHMQRLDWLTTVEELWSTVNSLPKIQQLGVGSTYIFSRNDKDPSFETFPNGARVVVSLFRAPATELGVETILATVLGESISQEGTDNKAVCDVIRVSARPSREHNDTLRVEVWLNDQSYSSAVAAALKKALQRRDISAALFSITDSPFESTKSPVSTTAAGKGAASPTSPGIAADVPDVADTADTAAVAAVADVADVTPPGASSTAAKADGDAAAEQEHAPVDAEPSAVANESPANDVASKSPAEESTSPGDGEDATDGPAPEETASPEEPNSDEKDADTEAPVEADAAAREPSKDGDTEDATVVEVTPTTE